MFCWNFIGLSTCTRKLQTKNSNEFLTCGVKDDGSSRKNHKVGKKLEIFVGILGNIILHFYTCMCACIPRGDLTE